MKIQREEVIRMETQKIIIRDSESLNSPKKRFCDAVKNDLGEIYLVTKDCTIKLYDLLKQVNFLKSNDA